MEGGNLAQLEGEIQFKEDSQTIFTFHIFLCFIWIWIQVYPFGGKERELGSGSELMPLVALIKSVWGLLYLSLRPHCPAM